MDYNTSRKKLILPEYGRNVQMMVDHAITLEDRDKRNLAAETIIRVMSNMNPQLKENLDFKHKLWDHIHIIADFKLDIDAPFPVPEKELLEQAPARLPYPKNKIKFMHYGKVVEMMIEKALEMEPGEKRDLYAKFIANHMKLSYMVWNKDGVPNEVIFKALSALSNGQLTLPEGTQLIDHKEPPAVPKKNKKGKQHYKKNR